MPVIKQPGFRHKVRLFIFGILLLAGLLIVLSAIALMLWADKMPQSLFLSIIFVVLFSSTMAATTSLFFVPFLESYLLKILTPAYNIELVSVSNHIVEPGERFRPSVTVKVKSGELREDRGDVLRCIDPNCDNDSIVRFGAFPHVEVKGITRADQTYTFTFPANGSMIAPDTLGTYTSNWRVWQEGHWAGPNIQITFRVEPSTSIVPPPNSAGLSLAFSDDFNDGNAEDWSPSGTGSWVVENGEYVVDMGEGQNLDSASVAGDSKWTDYVFEVDIKGEQGVDKHIYARYIDAENQYIVNLRGDPHNDVLLLKRHGGLVVTHLIAVPYSNDNHVSYRAKMVLYGARIRVSVDNVELINYNDIDRETLLTHGKIGLLSHTGSTGKDKVRYDNVMVNTINP